ncbi:hypothetical protein PFICI_10304 [Pestalotiopsis fici W106-1]|uniref:Endo-chitosanase n=1 Tax=Pestalotiopsis fici (strain W106-1 / CGMCC3.15140) TaxID=1229662 RepID=W3WYS1_PESFW|nr:uncharacterized protein PFICI_10304 [Pestalotiopsis fici W106-1]ETS78242.1 hypothetical protein PFICI_10304 [Pestalotiopsis fici W106-1]
MARSNMVPSNIREFYNGLLRNRTCTNKLATGFYSTIPGTNSFSYCGDHLADYNVVYIQGTNAQLADMDVDCDGAIQSGSAENDGRCPSSSPYRSSQTAFRDTVQSYGKGIQDLDPNIHSFIVFGNDFNRGDVGGPGNGGPGGPGSGGPPGHGGGGGPPGHGGGGGPPGHGGGGGPPGHGGGGGPPGHGGPPGGGHGGPGGGSGGGHGGGGHGGGGWGGGRGGHGVQEVAAISFDPKNYGIQPLSVMAVVCDNKLFYGVWGDTAAADPPLVGAASISLATACFGRGMSNEEGHDAKDVLYIAFPGADAVPGRDGAAWRANTWTNFHESIAALGDRLIQRIPGSGNWTRPPSYSMTTAG